MSVSLNEQAAFKPEDYSRFLIREFLKKNGFEKTYDQFMKEDTRPKVTMTKNELTKLLGIENLVKRNQKMKMFETMLDVLCDFLVLTRKVSGGIQIPTSATSQANHNISSAFSSEETNASTSQAIPQNPHSKPKVNPNSSTNVSALDAVSVSAARKAGSQVRQVQNAPPVGGQSKTQANWFQQQPQVMGNMQDKKINQKRPLGQLAAEEDDWDLEEENSKNADGYIPTAKTKAQQDPWSNLNSQPAQKQPQIPIPQARKKVPAKATEELDDLDDLMGFGVEATQEKAKQKGGNQEGVMRDTLGFLKKSEIEKKQKEEQKKKNQQDATSKYKSLQEVNHSLNGYQPLIQYDYDCTTASIPAAVRQKLKTLYQEQPVNQSESNEIRKLLFKSYSANFHDSWHQGFFFHNKIHYGLYQKEGGPCGILASVQAFFLKHLLFISKTPAHQISKGDKRDNLIAAALVDILLNSSDQGTNPVTLVIPAASQNPKNPILPHQCIKLVTKTTNHKSLFELVKDNLGYFVQADGHGVVLLVYSIILTKGIQNIYDDIDMKDNSLLTEHGYASQELINIILVGKAASNVFDGEKDMGDNFILKGISRQSEIGFLTLFEAYGYFQVGNFLKNPLMPIWIICSESHYSVIFSPDLAMASKKSPVFDLIYYDELAKQEDDYVMTVRLGAYKGPLNLQETSEMIPPIDAVIRTRWDRGLIDWNGRQAIL